ncbi:hypothetical protein D082_27070 [Synechocystis sp. PCC 6714]|nr:hypothetical protein D082_27070 [Synechocystis sp. PCC 6714]
MHDWARLISLRLHRIFYLLLQRENFPKKIRFFELVSKSLQSKNSRPVTNN